MKLDLNILSNLRFICILLFFLHRLPLCYSNTIYITYHFSSAPRRRSQGTDVVLVPPATAKPTTTCTTTVASTSVVTSSSGITSATSATKDPNSENLPANPVGLCLVSLQCKHMIFTARNEVGARLCFYTCL